MCNHQYLISFWSSRIAHSIYKNDEKILTWLLNSNFISHWIQTIACFQILYTHEWTNLKILYANWKHFHPHTSNSQESLKVSVHVQKGDERIELWVGFQGMKIPITAFLQLCIIIQHILRFPTGKKKINFTIQYWDIA